MAIEGQHDVGSACCTYRSGKLLFVAGSEVVRLFYISLYQGSTRASTAGTAPAAASKWQQAASSAVKNRADAAELHSAGQDAVCTNLDGTPRTGAGVIHVRIAGDLTLPEPSDVSTLELDSREQQLVAVTDQATVVVWSLSSGMILQYLNGNSFPVEVRHPLTTDPLCAHRALRCQ